MQRDELYKLLYTVSDHKLKKLEKQPRKMTMPK